MAKISQNSIPDINADWGRDDSNGLPYSGQAVQNFIKNQLQSKAGKAFFFNANDGNSLYSFESNETYEQWLAEGGSSDSELILFKTPFTFAGEMRRLTIDNRLATQSPFFTTNKKSAIIRFGYTSQYKGITESQWTDFDENAFVTIEVDKGFKGEYTKIVDGTRLLNGKDFEVDVYQHIEIGENKVRVTVVGETTETKGTLIYSVTLTSMYMLPSASGVNWHQPLVEGNQFSFGTFNIGGTVNKTVKVRVSYNNQSGAITYTDYEKNIGSNIYVNTPYSFAIDLRNNFPKDELGTSITGVCKTEIWVESGNASTDHLTYYLMFVAASESSTAKLACINDIQTIKNGSTSRLFDYAVYDGSSGITSVDVKIGHDNDELYSQTLSAATQTKHQFIAEINKDSELATFDLNVIINVVGGEAMFANIPVDNSASYPAMAGYNFYFNASNRNNGESNKNILNEASKQRIPSTFENISWVDGLDGYTTDESGVKGLRIPAKCKGEISVYPFASLSNLGLTIEMQYRVSNAADSDEPIISISDVRDKENYIANTFKGLIIAPNKIVVNKANSSNTLDAQSYNTKDNEIVHIVLVVVPSYKGYGRLAQLYVNGSKKVTFEYEQNNDFSLTTSKLILGSNTADLTLYKMRVYPQGFTWEGAFKNYVNSYHVFEEKSLIWAGVNNIVTESFDIDYHKVKDAGLNVMVVEMLTEDGLIPSNVNGVEEGNSNVYIKIHNAIDGECDSAFKQFFNVDTDGYVIENEKIEGQGTTAMTYARWNFRWKMGEAHGKRRITAKKNVASAMQSHKMGATRMFNDVMMLLIGENKRLANGTIPVSIGANDKVAKRVAVYQYPVFGFQKSTDEEGNEKYDFIGLYTIGPDKGDKKTFGFNDDENLIHLEGADHDIASVGFEYPWSKMSVGQNADGDDIMGGVGKNGIVGAWEIGAASKTINGETSEDFQQILNEEFRGAYDVANLNNPYIIGLTETEFADMLNNPKDFSGRSIEDGSYKGVKYTACEFYQHGVYDTYHYDIQTEKFELLGVNAVSDLGISTSGKSESVIQEEIREARRERFRQNAGNYWNVWDSIYHYAFVVFLGATDNFMKNTYPYKFRNLADGGRWRWRQDDLDTILDVNNRGAAVKKYSILVGDKNKSDGNSTYVGDSSVFWTLLRECYASEIKEMGKNILEALNTLSGSGKTNKIEGVLEYLNKRWFGYAQNYFGIAGYNEDTEWTYEDIWGMEKAGNSYQTADPLLQALGSHYEAEYQWLYLRVIFFSSLVGFGDFSDYEQGFTGRLAYRAGGSHTFKLVPAIDFSPLCVLGGNSDFVSDYTRRTAGEIVELSYPQLQDTEVYLMGAHYIRELGDLCTLKTGANSGNITFKTRMLQNIKIGDEDASKVTTNVTQLTLEDCPSLESIDARNATTLSGTLDLSKSPRINSALLEGSSVTSVLLPNGSKIETLHLPETITNVSFVKLPKLNEGFSIASFDNISMLRLEENAYLNGFDLLRQAYANAQNLGYIRVVGFNNQGTAEDVTLLKNLATEITESGVYRYHGITADGEAMPSEMKTEKRDYAPVIQGSLRLTTPVYKSELEEVENLYNKDTLNIESDKYYIEFEDPEVKRIILAAGIGDGYGVMQTGTQYVDADEVTTQLQSAFKDNSLVVRANEMDVFTNYNANLSYAFQGCTSLIEATLSSNRPIVDMYIFDGCKELKKVNWLDVAKTYISERAFSGCSSLTTIGGIENVNMFGTNAFRGCSSLNVDILLISTSIVGGSYVFGESGIKSFSAPNVESWSNMAGTFYKCANLESVNIPKLTLIGQSLFYYCTGIKNITLGDVTEINTRSFEGAFAPDSNIQLTFDRLGFLGDYAFQSSNIRSFSSVSVTSIGVNCFSSCELLTDITLNALTKISQYAFRGCYNLSDAHINSAEVVSNNSFYRCTNLKSISLPNVKEIGSNAFIYSGLEEIIMPNVETIGNNALDSLNLQGEYSLMKLKSIGSYAFRGVKISKLEVESLETIGTYAFVSSNITELIQKTDTPLQIASNAFQNCAYLTSVNVNNLVSIEASAFSGCAKLSYINPMNLTYINGGAFNGCSGLAIDFVAPYLTSIRGYSTFTRSSITKLIVPNTSGLGKYELQHCNYLTEIVLGNAVKINDYAINQCSNLSRVVIYLEEEPEQLGAGNFENCNNCLIYVPDNLVETVKTITGWSGKASRIKSFSEGNIPTDKEELLAQYTTQL